MSNAELSKKGIIKLKELLCYRLTTKLNNLEFDETLVDLAEAEKEFKEFKEN